MPARSEALLFAYGTLMRGYPLHAVLARGATFLGMGSVAGRLLDLGRHPGLVAGRGRVSGEIYRCDDPQLLPILDREEGYNFQRRRAIVTLADGRRTRAWVYRYRGPRERARPIVGGDYRAAKPSPGRNPWR
ncbi:MAG TPA: gamma-glutamylcyclotransferase family protein [Methylomirabilota bacterium]|nr:gamma-glutamylcyclotransferase family protein [Methylomirabilota bacterium]